MDSWAVLILTQWGSGCYLLVSVSGHHAQQLQAIPTIEGWPASCSAQLQATPVFFDLGLDPMTTLSIRSHLRLR